METRLKMRKNILFCMSYYNLLMMAGQWYLQRNPVRKTRSYVRKVNLKRYEKGEYHTLIQEIRESDPETHFRTFRMSKETFDTLFGLVKHNLSSKPTHRQPLDAGERLPITLRVLASGDSHFTVAASYRLARCTVSKTVRQTCRILYECLKKEYLPQPDSAMWQRNAEEFQKYWQFPNCCGAIDGKHVVIQAPANSGSMYYNYKGHHSIVLMAVVDARYRFTAIDVGGYGRQSDGGTFGQWDLRQSLDDGTIGIPSATTLSGTEIRVPHVFVADEAFPLRMDLMRPYGGRDLSHEKRIFNYRLSRARRIVENAFGILAARWRVLRKAMEYHPTTVDAIICACVVLHNFLCSQHATGQYMGGGYADSEKADGRVKEGKWRREHDDGKLLPADPVKPKQNKDMAEKVRKDFMDYFNSEAGRVSWQDDIVCGKQRASRANSVEEIECDGP